MTILKINGVEYPAKITLGAIKRACAATNSKTETELFDKGINGISAIVYESIIDKKQLTSDQFDDALTIQEVSGMFVELSGTTEKTEGGEGPNGQ